MNNYFRLPSFKEYDIVNIYISYRLHHIEDQYLTIFLLLCKITYDHFYHMMR